MPPHGITACYVRHASRNVVQPIGRCQKGVRPGVRWSSTRAQTAIEKKGDHATPNEREQVMPHPNPTRDGVKCGGVAPRLQNCGAASSPHVLQQAAQRALAQQHVSARPGGESEGATAERSHVIRPGNTSRPFLCSRHSLAMLHRIVAKRQPRAAAARYIPVHAAHTVAGARRRAAALRPLSMICRPPTRRRRGRDASVWYSRAKGGARLPRVL